MSKKPLIKDSVKYFNDSLNWFDIWEDKDTGFHIQKLKHVKCIRLVMEDHKINEYVHYDESVLKYFPGAKTLRDMHIVNAYSDFAAYEKKELIRYHWEEEQ